jgi:hypothetical protein
MKKGNYLHDSVPGVTLPPAKKKGRGGGHHKQEEAVEGGIERPEVVCFVDEKLHLNKRAADRG